MAALYISAMQQGHIQLTDIMQWQHGCQDHQRTLQCYGGTHNPKFKPAKLSSNQHSQDNVQRSQNTGSYESYLKKGKRFSKALTFYAGCPSLISVIVQVVLLTFSHFPYQFYGGPPLSVNTVPYNTVCQDHCDSCHQSIQLILHFPEQAMDNIKQAETYRWMKKNKTKSTISHHLLLLPGERFVKKDSTCPPLKSLIYVEPTFSMLISIGRHLAVSPLRTVLANQVTCQSHFVTLDSISVCACLIKGIFILQCET